MLKLMFFMILSLVPALVFPNSNKVDKYSSTTALTLTIVSQINTTCEKKNGRVIAQASGGVAPYVYDINGPYSNINGAFINMLAGNYTVTVTDAIGQVATQNVVLTNTFLSPRPSVLSKTRPTTCTSRDATLTLAGTGGVAPYTYSLDNITYQPSNTFSNLTSGVYRYAVKDANGCSSWPSPLNGIYYTVIDINSDCAIYVDGGGAGYGCNPSNLTVIVHYQSVNPPYTFSIDGIHYQSSNTFNGLSIGLVTFWIKDGLGNILLHSLSFMDECNDAFSVTAIPQFAHCGQGGSITVTASQGASPYLYSIDGGINFQASNQFPNLAPGTYTVTVRDADGYNTSKLTIVRDNCVVATATPTSSTCSKNNGKIEAVAHNGTAPYQYSLDGINFSTSNIFTGLLANSYTVYVKDDLGDISHAPVVVTDIPGPQILNTVSTPTSCDNRSGTINVTAQGGTGNIFYSINGTTFQSTGLFSGLAKGMYTITIKDEAGCVSTKEVEVTQTIAMPVVNLGNDVTLCEGNTLLLDATNTNATYLWQDASTAPTFLVTKAGRYIVKVDRQGCIVKDTIDIAYELKPKFTLGEDRGICLGRSLILDPKLTAVNYLWQDGTTTATYKVTQPGTYSLSATNICGTTTDEVAITQGVCELYVPNAFTPNGDVYNNTFKAGYGDNVTTFRMQVYNRYGQVIFETRNKEQGWDGNFKGAKQPQGVYTWIIEYRTAINNNVQLMNGTVLLIR